VAWLNIASKTAREPETRHVAATPTSRPAYRRLCSHRGPAVRSSVNGAGSARCLEPARIPVVNIERKLGQPVGVMLAGLRQGDDLESVGRISALTEFDWPFFLDQWGVGRAFVCKVKVYLRPKSGFCNCTTGIEDDEELDQVDDKELIDSKFVASGPGRAIEVAWMTGLWRRKRVRS
jgi:hypothetical protein